MVFVFADESKSLMERPDVPRSSSFSPVVKTTNKMYAGELSAHRRHSA
jgi:hypothetical protein